MSLPMALTMGDPAGVGPELTRKAWRALHQKDMPFFWIGDPTLLGEDIPVRRIEKPEQAIEYFPRALPVIPVQCPEPVQAGIPNSVNASAVIQSIEQAVRFVQEGESGAVVTNPIAKHVLSQAGFQHPGHTEFLAALCGVSGQEVMMLACSQLKVVLTTIHISLKDAIKALNQERIIEVAHLTAASLQRDFGLLRPRLAVAGLNPHAGENGLMGEEEQRIIAPAIEKLRQQGYDVMGPMPPDTMFSAAARPRYDAAICLYHDQGLIPVKTLDMAGGVNITLGLPIIRTSPDHGTAFDIATHPGEVGKADVSSLLAALATAHEMSQQRRKNDADLS